MQKWKKIYHGKSYIINNPYYEDDAIKIIVNKESITNTINQVI